MGIGFVLLLWAIVGAVLAAFAGTVLAVVVRHLTSGAEGSVRWVLCAFIYPVALVPYCLIAFVGYGLWCETFRGVDAGLGDTWRVPLANGYALVMIDTPQQAFIAAPNGEQSHMGLTAIGVRGGYVAGSDPTGERRYFVIDAANRTESTFSSLLLAEEACRKKNVAVPLLRPPEAEYYARRWSLADLFAALGAAVPPLFIGAFLLVRFASFVRGHRPHRYA